MQQKSLKNAQQGQQVSVMAQEKLMLAIFLFHHQWRCTYDWEVAGVHDKTIHLLAQQKRLKDEYNDPDELPKVNKADMAGMMESIEEYLRSSCHVTRVPLA